MSSPSKVQAQIALRTDGARVVQLMSGLIMPPPLINFCLDFAFGPDQTAGALPGQGGARMIPMAPMGAPVARSYGSRRSSDDASSKQSSRTTSRATSRHASFDAGDAGCHFELRRMDSGDWGQNSLTSPPGRRRDAQGFGNQPEQLVFDLQIQ